VPAKARVSSSSAATRSSAATGAIVSTPLRTSTYQELRTAVVKMGLLSVSRYGNRLQNAAVSDGMCNKTLTLVDPGDNPA